MARQGWARLGKAGNYYSNSERLTVITVVCMGYVKPDGERVPCGKVLGTKDGQGVSGVSHSYCADCLKRQMEP